MVGGPLLQRDRRISGSQHQEQAGNFLLVIGEILGSRDQVPLEDAILPCSPYQRRHHPPQQLRMVAGHRVGARNGERGAGAVGFGDAGYGSFQALQQAFALAHVERSHGAQHGDVVGNDVAANAALDAANGDYRGALGDIDMAARDTLQRRQDLSGDVDRVHAQPGRGTVGLATGDLDLNAVGGGHEAAAAVAQGAGIVGPHVQPDNGLGSIRSLEDSLANHQFGAALFSGRSAFLGGLENELHRASEQLAILGQHFRCAHQHGDVSIVATGVHHRDFPAHVFPLCLRGKGQAGLFQHRQPVHIGAQRNYRARLAAAEGADHAGVGNTGFYLIEAEAPEVGGDLFRGAKLPVREFGIGVQVAAPLDNPWFDRREGRFQVGLIIGCGADTDDGES